MWPEHREKSEECDLEILMLGGLVSGIVEHECSAGKTAEGFEEI